MGNLWQKSRMLLIPVLALFVSLTLSAPVNAATCNHYVLAYPAWYNGLEGCAKAQGTSDTDDPVVSKLNDIWLLALNAVQWLIITAGYVALALIITGGFRYMTSQGDSGRVVAAKGMILHAVVGLVIALAAVVIIRTIQNVINGTLGP